MSAPGRAQLYPAPGAHFAHNTCTIRINPDGRPAAHLSPLAGLAARAPQSSGASHYPRRATIASIRPRLSAFVAVCRARKKLQRFIRIGIANLLHNTSCWPSACAPSGSVVSLHSARPVQQIRDLADRPAGEPLSRAAALPASQPASQQASQQPAQPFERPRRVYLRAPVGCRARIFLLVCR